jgi:hypothetical protein
MKNFIAITGVGLGAVAGAGYLAQPAEFDQFTDPTLRALE